MQAFKVYKGLNVDDELQRIRNAKKIIASLIRKLESGWSPFADSIGENKIKSSDNWENSISDFLRFKSTQNIEERTINEYRHKANKFFRFINEKKWGNLHVSLFNYDHAIEFMDWLRKNNCKSGKTLQEYRCFVGQIFKHLCKKQLVSQNFSNYCQAINTKVEHRVYFRTKI